MDKNKKSFTETVKEFIKGASAAVGDTPTETTPAPTGEEGASNLETLYADLKTALDANEVQLEAESIKTWAKGKGLSDEQAQDLCDTVLDGVEGEQAEPKAEPDGDETEMQKSILKYLGEVDGSFKEFKKSKTVFEEAITALVAQNKKLSQEVVFLKSELGKISKEPVGVKNPATTVSDIKPAKTRPEMLEAFSKSILKEQALMIEDQQYYLSNGVLNEKSAKYFKEQGII